MITVEQLNGFLGKHISDICENDFTKDSDNHCAHFVSHVLGYTFGVTCRTMGHGEGLAANLRVQEIFPRCTSVGTWDTRPTSVTSCLVFITKDSNVNLKTKVMANVPRKHIGIFLNGSIWHYSNTQGKVVKQTPSEFSNHYPSPHNTMFFGALL